MTEQYTASGLTEDYYVQETYGGYGTRIEHTTKQPVEAFLRRTDQIVGDKIEADIFMSGSLVDAASVIEQLGRLRGEASDRRCKKIADLTFWELLELPIPKQLEYFAYRLLVLRGVVFDRQLDDDKSGCAFERITLQGRTPDWAYLADNITITTRHWRGKDD